VGTGTNLSGKRGCRLFQRLEDPCRLLGLPQYARSFLQRIFGIARLASDLRPESWVYHPVFFGNSITLRDVFGVDCVGFGLSSLPNPTNSLLVPHFTGLWPSSLNKPICETLTK